MKLIKNTKQSQPFFRRAQSPVLKTGEADRNFQKYPRSKYTNFMKVHRFLLKDTAPVGVCKAHSLGFLPIESAFSLLYCQLASG